MEHINDDAPLTTTHFFDRLENWYLAAIRVLALIGATLLLAWAAWSVVSGLYKVLQDPASVKEVPAQVSTEDVVAITVPEETTAGSDSTAATAAAAAAKRYYNGFVSRYHALYQGKFAPFRQASDKPLTRAAFDARYVRSAERLKKVADGEMSLNGDKSELEALLTAMTSVASAKATTDRLSAYRKAKRQKVVRTIRSTSYEVYCRQYGFYIEACIDYGTRAVPRARQVTETRLPKGVISPPELFQAYQDRYFSLLAQRRAESADKASAARSEIALGNVVGANRLWTAAYIVGAFVSLMFLFLLIAIERHQRRIARELPVPAAE